MSALSTDTHGHFGTLPKHASTRVLIDDVIGVCGLPCKPSSPFGALKVQMTQSRSEVLQGTLEMMVLKLLTLEPMHGWGLSFQLRQVSREVFDVNQGSLYPALQRMLTRGWIRSEWRPSENNRRARYYAISREGEKQLALSMVEWERSSGAVNRVLRFAT